MKKGKLLYKKNKKKLKNIFLNPLRQAVYHNRFPVFIIFVVFLIFWMLISPSLRSISALLDLLREYSPNIITAIGIGILMIGGEFDLSVGSLLAFTGVTAVLVFNITGNIYMGIIAGFISGLAIGVFNSFLVNWLKISSLIATLAMMFTLRGIVYVFTRKVAIVAKDLPEAFSNLYYGSIGRIPIPFIFVIVILIVFTFIMTRTVYGRNIFAMGGNPEAAVVSGINVNRIKFTLFVICSLLSSLSGLLLVAQTSTGFFDMGVTGWELLAITACVLGGIVLGGGEGSLIDASIGMLVIGITNKGMRFLGLHTSYMLVVNGLILIFALYIHQLRKSILIRKQF